MGPYKGDYPAGFAPPLAFMFSTFSSDDPSASVANSGIAVTDIEVYKNGVATTRASDAGYVLLDTDGINFAGHVGIGGFSIDIDNDTDAGFFAAGQEYDVVLASITVDGATINFHAGSFSIERAGGVLALLKGTNSLSDIEGKVDTLTTTVGTAGDGLTAIPAAVDWLDGGRLDLILDIIAADTTTDIPALIATAQADLNLITGADGAVVATAGIVAASYAAGARDAAGQATDAEEAMADALLARNIAGGSNTGRIVTDSLRIMRNRKAIAGGTLTVYQEDDSTAAWTAAVTTATGDPITEIDPV